jgi:hypothetical protein
MSEKPEAGPPICLGCDPRDKWAAQARAEMAARKKAEEQREVQVNSRQRSRKDFLGLLKDCYRFAIDGRARDTFEFFLAAVFTVLTFGLWTQPMWWEGIVDVSSILIGFSISGFAIVCSVGGETFRALLGPANPNDAESPAVIMAAEFTFFVLLQFGALILAILCKSFYRPDWFDAVGPTLQTWLTYGSKALWGLSFFIFWWSITLGIGSALYLFRLNVQQNDAARLDLEFKPKDQKKSDP